MEDYLQCLAKIDALASSSDTPVGVIMGDLNADPQQDTSGNINHLFGQELVKFCSEEDYTISDVELLSAQDIVTYVGPNGVTSWLDHLITTTSAHALVTSIEVKNGFISSDHLPVIATVSLPSGYDRPQIPQEGTTPTV